MRILLILVFVLFSSLAVGQVVLQNNPPGLHWKKINTLHFRIIFPEGFNQSAQRVANTLEHIYEIETKPYGLKPKRISIVLQNQSSESNAFISMQPRRGEFYTMPSQDYNFIGNNDWLDLLAIHEYRHVVQYRQATRGFNKLMLNLFGYPTFGALAQISVPMWFWEGDAVYAETALTSSGRGRIPNFGLVFRSNLLEGRTFNYHKQYLQSYKHNIPNHYVLGYHMVSYLRRKNYENLFWKTDPWKEDIWKKITSGAWNVPFMPFGFSASIKAKTGMSVTKLYKEMAWDLKKEWRAEIAKLKLTEFQTVNLRKNRVYADYLYPQPQPDGSVLALKRGIGTIDKFVLLKPGKKGKEHTVFTPGPVNDAGMISSNNGSVVWNEYRYDPRWKAKSYSTVVEFSFTSEGKRKFRREFHGKTRYSSAALSTDKKMIATVESDQNYNHTLVVLSLITRNVIKKFPNPENHFYSMPRFGEDNQIVVLKTSSKGKTISIINFQTGEMTDVFPVGDENFGYPILSGNYVLFNSPVSGIDNIYAYNLSTKTRLQITSSKYGAYNPAISPDNKSIFYNEQTADGLDVVRIDFNPENWIKFEEPEDDKNFYKILDENDGHRHLMDSTPTTKFVEEKYSRFKGMINPYGWGPAIQNDPNKATLVLSSQDILSTTKIGFGYTFDINERTGLWKGDFSYQGWYPIIDVSYSNGKRKVNGEDIGVINVDTAFYWREETITAGIRLPLITTRSKFHTGITFSTDVGYTRLHDYPFQDVEGLNSFTYNHYNVTAYSLLKTSKRDIYSKWGNTLLLDYYLTPPKNTVNGELFSIVDYVYLPGLLRHHSFNGYIAYQENRIPSNLTSIFDDYIFRSNIPTPRGITLPRFMRTVTSSANYTFPLFYPDIAVGPFLNIQRVRINMFFDYALGNTPSYSTESNYFSTTGGEVKFDLNIFRFFPQIDIGLRYSYAIQPGAGLYEILIGTFNF